MQDGPEAPVERHEVLAVTELDVEESEALHDYTDDGNEEAKGCDGEEMHPSASDAATISSRFLFEFRMAFFSICQLYVSIR